jgi:hypothetical protein
MLEILKFVAIYNFVLVSVYFIGRQYFSIFFKNDSTKFIILKSIPINYFYFIVGFFVLGNYIFILNFFTGVRLFYVLVPIFIALLFQARNIVEYLKFNIVSISTSFIFSFSFLNNNGSLDGYSYHFLNQNLIRNEKIIFGLANLEPHYGILSIFEYLSSILWFENNFVLIQIINLVFLSNFFNILHSFLKSKNVTLVNLSIITLLIGFLDNVGLGGGRNGFYFIQEVGKFDSSFGIVYFICFIFLYYFSRNYFKDYLEVHILLISITLLIQTRSFGYILFLPLVIIMFKYRNVINLRYFIRNKIIILINVLWVIKSLIVSTCLIYPLQLTCFNGLNWSNAFMAQYLSTIATANNRDPVVNNLDLNSFNWIFDSWLTNNSSYLFNILSTTLIIFFTLLLFIKLLKSSSNIGKFDFIYKTLFIYSFFSIIFWFLSFPNYRFLPGFIMSLYFIIFANYLNFSNFFHTFFLKPRVNKFILVFAIAFLVVRLDSYLSISDYDKNLFSNYVVPFQEYSIKKNSYGTTPNGVHCLINTKCSKSEQNIYLKNIYTYKVLIPYDNFYYSNILEQYSGK